jgi:tripartite-type tricarboxylate transporter receptor subunit TctC
MKSFGCAAAAILATGFTAGASAQSYPERPIRFVVAFPPGGSVDFTARILARHLPALLGQSIVVDNRGGGGGNIASDIVAKAAPDGYTFLLSTEGPITINPSVYAKLAFVPMRDLPAVTYLIKYPNIVVVNATVPIASLKELIQHAKANPGKLRYAHPGTGSGQQLAVELFKMTVGVDIISVPYKGGGPAMVSVAGNETNLSFATPPSALPHVKTGKVRAIGQTGAKRSPALPDLPTVAEAGVAGYGVEGWVGLFAPAKTPDAALRRMHQEVTKVLHMQEVKDLVLTAGSETVPTETAETRKGIAAETAMWAKVVKTAGIRIE